MYSLSQNISICKDVKISQTEGSLQESDLSMLQPDIFQ